MANPNPDPPPAPLSAAELRRRLLSSTPPVQSPPAPGAVDFDVPPPEPTPAAPTAPRATADALRGLRLPGQPLSVPPEGGPASGFFAAGPLRAAINNPTPVSGIRMPGAPAAFGHTAAPDPGTGVLHTPQPRSPADTAPPGPRLSSTRPDDPAADVARLKTENKELRQLLGEMKQLLQEASDTEQQFANREQELQATLTDKQRQIDELNSQLQGIEEQIASGVLAPPQPAAPPKTRTELEEWADELEKESAKLAQDRKRLEADRQQLRDDEEALEKQMRDMEVSMARERALMARQETELKRLSAEIQHELEMMQRGDVALRDQMAKFQRRAQDVMQGKVNQPPQTGQSAWNLPGLPPPPPRR